MDNLNYNQVEVYKPTAEVCGMILVQLQKKPDQSPFEQLLKDKVRNILKLNTHKHIFIIL
jgi:hypothetical protein